MKLSSSSFAEGENIPTKFTCQGEDISPELLISDVPPETKSLALILEDPDAPSGDWVHWIIWNIPPETIKIPENVGASFAVQGNTSAGKPNYGGPCPPSGSHRYIFKLYALSEMLDISATSDKAAFMSAIAQKTLAEFTLNAKYQKT